MAEQASIEYQLSANLNQFRADMQRATQVVQSSAGQMQNAFGRVQSAVGVLRGLIGGAFAGLSVAGFASAINSAAAKMADFEKAAQQTGNTVESLSKSLSAIKPEGGKLEDLIGLSDRLGRALKGADDETKNAGAAFAALGIKVTDTNGNLRPTMDLLRELGQRLNGYADGANKVVIAQTILGRSGNQAIPMLRELGRASEQNAKVTTEMAEAAERYEKELIKLSSQGDALKLKLFAPIVEALGVVITGFNDARAAGQSFVKALEFGLARNDRPLDALDDARKKVEDLERALARAKEGGFANKVKNILDLGFEDAENVESVRRQLEQARTELAKTKASIAEVIPLGPKSVYGDAVKPDAPRVPGKEETDKQDALRKRAQDALVAIQREAAGYKEMSKEAEVLFELEKGRFKEFDKAFPKFREQALLYARQADAVKQAEAALESMANAENRAVEEAKKLDEQFKQWLKSLLDATEVEIGKKQADDIEKLNEEFRRGAVDATRYQQALANLRDQNPAEANVTSALNSTSGAIRRRRDDELARLAARFGENGNYDTQQFSEAAEIIRTRLNPELENSNKLSDQLARAFVGSMEQAATRVQSLSEVLQGLLNNILRALSNVAADVLQKSDIWQSLFTIGVGTVTGGAGATSGASAVPGRWSGYTKAIDAVDMSSARPAGKQVSVVINQTIDSRTDQAEIRRHAAQAAEIAQAQILRSIQAGGTFQRAIDNA